jgi:hypothetical protein
MTAINILDTHSFTEEEKQEILAIGISTVYRRHPEVVLADEPFINIYA